MKDKLLSFLVLPSIMFALFLAFSPVGRVEATGGTEKVTICHHNEGSKGFTENTVDIASIFRNNGHLTHQEDKKDIIPETIFDAYTEVGEEHRHCSWGWVDWRGDLHCSVWGSWKNGGKHGNKSEKLWQEERKLYECPSSTTQLPGYPVKCSFSGMGNQTILNNHCIVPAEVTCPTACGYEGGSVADGDGGLKNCPATSACPLAESCPTDCGYPGGTVPDGKGGENTCAPTNSCSTYRWCSPDETSPTGFKARAISISIPTPEDGGKPWDSGKMIDLYCAYPAAGVCPTECGYEGGDEVPDGQGGQKTCLATNSCSTYRWCSPDETSPTGYKARAISISISNPEDGGKPWDSGKMIDQYCAYPAAGVCPTECGYKGGDEVADGEGGTIKCLATQACEVPDDEDDDDEDVRGATDDTTKDTGVVLAATGPTDNIVVYMVELLLVAMLVTYSVFFTKTYLKNSK